MPAARSTRDAPSDTGSEICDLADASDPARSAHDPDPRLNEAYIRRIRPAGPGAGAGGVVLVGAVHDHPASQYRAARVVGSVRPSVLALELPPLALPLYEAYAADAPDGEVPPARGGEMSAAIRAAETERVVGVDGPSAAFAGRLLRTLARQRAPPSTVRSSLRSLVAVTRRAAACRLAAVVGERPGLGLAVEPDADYASIRDDVPAAQASDEREQVRRARSVLQAFGSSPSSRLREETREAHMAARLSALRREGDVVAVVGIDHLDPIADALRERADDA